MGMASSEYLEKGKSGLAAATFLVSNAVTPTPHSPFCTPHRATVTTVITICIGIMLGKTLFPGVAVVTGAGGSGRNPTGLSVGHELISCRHRSCRRARIGSRRMQQNRHY